MNQSPDPSPAELLAKQQQGRRIMLAIVAIFVLPFFIAPLLKNPDQMGTSNKGTLIEPHVYLMDLQLMSHSGVPFRIEDLNGRWNFLYVLPESCESDCAMARDHALYAMRQVRLSLDRNIDRVQHVLVFTQTPDSSVLELLDTEFSIMFRAHGERALLDQALLQKTSDGSPAGNIYLVSPDGYVFMTYPTFADEGESVLRARDMRADLKKSIKGDRTF